MRRRTLLAMAWLAYSLTGITAQAEEAKTIALFNGKNLSGWEYFLTDESAKMEDVWSVQDAVLVCKGEPMGFLATKKKFKNYKLTVVWRWAPGKEPGNSGVLLRVTGEKMMLPKCVEAQLKSGSAGDIWAFQGFQIAADSPRFQKRESPAIGNFMGVAKESGNEKEPGEWNTYEITLDGGQLTLMVNGKKVNECAGCDIVAGQIALQSEGGEIHFQKVEITPLAN
jgi:hypothetical protein